MTGASHFVSFLSFDTDASHFYWLNLLPSVIYKSGMGIIGVFKRSGNDLIIVARITIITLNNPFPFNNQFDKKLFQALSTT